MNCCFGFQVVQCFFIAISQPKHGLPSAPSAGPHFDTYIFQVTGFSGVPPMLVAIAKSPLAKKYDLSSLRLIGSGGAPLPEAVANAVAEITGARILQG